jgi:hypothetical protein
MTEEEKQIEIAKIRAARAKPAPKPPEPPKVATHTPRPPRPCERKPADGIKIERFFDDRVANEAFTKDVGNVLKNYQVAEKSIILNTIKAYKPLCPIWNYSTANKILNIARLEIQYSEKIETLETDKDKTISRDFAQTLGYIQEAIEKEKKQIGIDSKSLKDKGDGSMNEAFADIVEKGKFDTRRFVCKVVIGQGKKKDSGEANASLSEFKHVSNEDVDKYLETATAN